MRAVVYVRCPGFRNGRVDPEPVDWDQQREEELWALLKDSSQDTDWAALARRFDVSRTEIQQMAAWLYEKELRLLRDKMARIRMSAVSESSDQANISETQTGLASSFGQNSGSFRGTPIQSPGNSLQGSGSESSAGFTNRRMLSASRMLRSQQSSSVSDSEFGFAKSSAPEMTSDDSVSRSALEEALLDRYSP